MSDFVDAGEVRRFFDNFSPALISRLSQYVGRYAIQLQSEVKSKYLSGSPLHQRSGNLFNSINIAPVKVTDHSVTSSVGTNLKYGRVHELGLTVTVPAHERTMSMVWGRPVDPFKVTVKSHLAHYPKRAFLAPALNDTQKSFFDLMDTAVTMAEKDARGGAA